MAEKKNKGGRPKNVLTAEQAAQVEAPIVYGLTIKGFEEIVYKENFRKWAKMVAQKIGPVIVKLDRLKNGTLRTANYQST